MVLVFDVDFVSVKGHGFNIQIYSLPLLKAAKFLIGILGILNRNKKKESI
jgi:hypothetical protein